MATVTEASMSLAGLVGEAEQATFHGAPGAALTVIAAATLRAQAEDAADELVALTWFQGVALAAAGAVGAALECLTAVLSKTAEGPRARLGVAWAASTSAHLHRQLGRNDIAEALDQHGYAAAEPLGTPALEARLDCQIGLVSDAVGRSDLDQATARLAEVDEQVAEAGEAARWRPRVRLDWSRAEVAILAGDVDLARRAAADALAAAEVNEAPRHEARSLLFAGVAALAAGDHPAAVADLRRCTDLAIELGTHPLIWRPAGLLAALTAGSDPSGSAALMATARASVQQLADATPSALRESWLARPDVAALLP